MLSAIAAPDRKSEANAPSVASNDAVKPPPSYRGIPCSAVQQGDQKPAQTETGDHSDGTHQLASARSGMTAAVLTISMNCLAYAFALAASSGARVLTASKLNTA